MPHVRTQLRNAVKTRLSTVSSLKGAHNITRLERGFQADNFPVALIAISESGATQPGSFEGSKPVTRSYQIAIEVAVQEEMADPEDALDAVCLDIEKAMTSSEFGIGAVQNWRYLETSPVHDRPTASGSLIAQTIIYSGEIQTLDSEPDRNLHC